MTDNDMEFMGIYDDRSLGELVSEARTDLEKYLAHELVCRARDYKRQKVRKKYDTGAHAPNPFTRIEAEMREWEIEHGLPSSELLEKLKGMDWPTLIYPTIFSRVFEYEVLAAMESSSPQGDILIALCDPVKNRYGWSVAGYGSCAGCDALERVKESGVYDVARLVDRIHRQVQWFETRGELLEYLAGMDLSTKHWWHDFAEIYNSSDELIGKLSRFIILKNK